MRAEVTDGEGIAVADLDLDELAHVREAAGVDPPAPRDPAWVTRGRSARAPPPDAWGHVARGEHAGHATLLDGGVGGETAPPSPGAAVVVLDPTRASVHGRDTLRRWDLPAGRRVGCAWGGVGLGVHGGSPSVCVEQSAGGPGGDEFLAGVDDMHGNRAAVAVDPGVGARGAIALGVEHDAEEREPAQVRSRTVAEPSPIPR